MHFPIHIKSTHHLFPKSDSVGVTFSSIFSTNVAVIYLDAIKLCLTRAFSFTLPRLLGSSQNNRTQIADRKGDREIYRVKNLGNEYMPNWYAEGEVEGTRSLLDLISADILQTRSTGGVTYLLKLGSQNQITCCRLEVCSRKEPKGDHKEKQRKEEAHVRPNRTYEVDEGKKSERHIIKPCGATSTIPIADSEFERLTDRRTVLGSLHAFQGVAGGRVHCANGKERHQ